MPSDAPLLSRTPTSGQTSPAFSLAPPKRRSSDGRPSCSAPPSQCPRSKAAQPRFRPCLLLTLPRCRTILPHQPNCWIHDRILRYDRCVELTATASQLQPAPYNPRGA